MAMRSHLFPYRTQKLSSSVSKILGWRRPGKIERCRHSFAAMAQVVEHVLGKDEVTSSNLVSSSKKALCSSEHSAYFFADLVLRRGCGGGLGRSPMKNVTCLQSAQKGCLNFYIGMRSIQLAFYSLLYIIKLMIEYSFQSDFSDYWRSLYAKHEDCRCIIFVSRHEVCRCV